MSKYQGMMTKRNVVLITGLFLLILTGIRLAWITFYMTPDHPSAIQGELDMRGWDFKIERSVALDGEWEFYPHTLFMQNSDTISSLEEKTFIQVPGKWNTILNPDKSSAFGYGSFRLRIHVNPDQEQTYSIHIPDIKTSSELFVNGRLLESSGKPTADSKQYTALNLPYFASFTADNGEIDIVIQAAHYDYGNKGGILKSIQLGSEAAVAKERWFSIGMQLVVCSLFLMHAIYACILYLIGTRQKVLLYFALVILCTTFTILTDDDKLLFISLPFTQEWIIKLRALSYLGAAVFLLRFTKNLLIEYSASRVFRWFSIFSAIYALLVILIPFPFVANLLTLNIYIFFFPLLIVPILTLRSAMKGEEDAIYLLLGATAITVNPIWGVIEGLGWVKMGYYPLDMIAFFIAFATFWFKRYFRNAEQTKQLAEQLQRTDKLKDDFLANTSHELRNPLHGIINIAQNVLDSKKSSQEEENKKNIELLVTVGRRMSLMLNDLLDLTQLKENKVRLQPSNLRIQSVIPGVLDMLRFMTEGKPIRLNMDIPETFPFVAADEKRLVQILFNLLHNAIKYTYEGSITIYAEALDDCVHIHISDTGIGMDEDTRLRAFEAYEQGDSGITAIGGGGMGLGLSICRQLVELHGGTIGVSSTPGQGSVFTFTLPLAEEYVAEYVENFEEHLQEHPEKNLEKYSVQQEKALLVLPVHDGYSAAATEATAGLPTPLPASNLLIAAGRPKILAVDDDPVNLKVISSILPIDQYELVTATSGKEAITKLDKEQWDLIIADVMMPHISGYELTRIIRERFSISELPILLLTARSRSEDVYSGFLSGANDYVTKPVDALELKSRVRALTDLKQSVGERLQMEAAYLQAQIQPHFLFNTLNSITALSILDTTKMHDLIEAFSAYLRISFDFLNSGRVVPIEYELDLVRAYLYIEKERFDERLDISWELDPNLQLQLPPLTIQPIVENALRHGILCRSRGGMVHIRITSHPASHADSRYTEISITDDGVGMDPDKVKQLLDSQPGKKRGIGLLNTDRRLKQMYGKGLTIQSQPGLGTTISFIVPE
ncbi:ATP-binding protein [Paenibacillus eucommiae]|uniref:histidine kinase n=1 Tax=Paenibacillus eucommiae TaxID=1355755 RepID=A0ABS4J841_9BACL|nr:ATP-binding protein [Paenibacillus eucommiae]MBP1996023.1 sensor histidine kinase YesM [Paenibacillus eucommiae]